MENSYIVLGNGFSIDLVQKMEKAEEIDLANLFSKGEHVLYPKTNTRGFLSRKYTPDLWNLGARTYMSYEAATQLVTDVSVISIVLIMDAYICANMRIQRATR